MFKSKRDFKEDVEGMLTRFDLMVERLKALSVEFPSSFLGWWLLSRMRLTPERRGDILGMVGSTEYDKIVSKLREMRQTINETFQRPTTIGRRHRAYLGDDDDYDDDEEDDYECHVGASDSDYD